MLKYRKPTPGPLGGSFYARNAMAITFGLLAGLIFAFICYLWNLTDGEWPWGW